MFQFKPINGWTKSAMIKMIQDQFTGKSLNEAGECMYRGRNGSKCAVGVFIPNTEYHPDMDNKEEMAHNGTDIGTVLEYFPNLSQFLPLELEALQKLQSVHDGKSVPQYGIDDSRSDTEIKAQLIQWINENVSE